MLKPVPKAERKTSKLVFAGLWLLLGVGGFIVAPENRWFNAGYLVLGVVWSGLYFYEGNNAWRMKKK